MNEVPSLLQVVEPRLIRVAQRVMNIVFGFSTIIFSVLGMYIASTQDPILLGAGMLIISPVMMASLRQGFEGPLRASFFNPKVMSYAFVVGDCILLPITFWFTGTGWQNIELGRDELLQYTVISAGVGAITMIGFQFLDGARYRSVGWASALKSPTKVWHDRVVMAVVTFMLTWLLLPQFLIYSKMPELEQYPAEFVGAIMGLWAFLSVCGLDMRFPPDPKGQHCRWNDDNFESIGTI